MSARSQTGVLDSPIPNVPVAVIDIETTGLNAGADRVVEVSVVRIEPEGGASIAIDTLVNPQRPVAATEIHGITDADVADAPTFADVAGDVASALSTAVLAAYNVYFDMRFLEDEFSRVGWQALLPQVCLMYMRPMLGLGSKCCLGDACKAHGIEHHGSHTAAYDAMAGAHLWEFYREVMSQMGVRTFGELASLKAYKFTNSLTRPLLELDAVAAMPRGAPLKPRHPDASQAHVTGRADVIHEYWDSVKAAVADLQISEEEVQGLADKRTHFGLTMEELRAVHGRVFAAALSDALSDSLVTDAEWSQLKRLHDCLNQLGWAPGT